MNGPIDAPKPGPQIPDGARNPERPRLSPGRQVVVDFWSAQLDLNSPMRFQSGLRGGDHYFYDLSIAGSRNSLQASLAAKVTSEQRAAFTERLTELLTPEEVEASFDRNEGGWLETRIGTDYHPDYILRTALADAGIEGNVAEFVLPSHLATVVRERRGDQFVILEMADGTKILQYPEYRPLDPANWYDREPLGLPLVTAEEQAAFDAQFAPSREGDRGGSELPPRRRRLFGRFGKS